MSSKSETRLTELESRLAHNERNADEISEVLTEQARLIDELSQRLHGLPGLLVGDQALGAGQRSARVLGMALCELLDHRARAPADRRGRVRLDRRWK